MKTLFRTEDPVTRIDRESVTAPSGVEVSHPAPRMLGNLLFNAHKLASAWFRSENPATRDTVASMAAPSGAEPSQPVPLDLSEVQVDENTPVSTVFRTEEPVVTDPEASVAASSGAEPSQRAPLDLGEVQVDENTQVSAVFRTEEPVMRESEASVAAPSSAEPSYSVPPELAELLVEVRKLVSTLSRSEGPVLRDVKESVVVPLTAEPMRPVPRMLGELLVDEHKLSRHDLKRGLSLQKKKQIRLGEALIKLKLTTEEDLHYALANQFSYPCLQRKSEAGLSDELVTAYLPFSPEAEAFRTLRSQLLLHWFDNEHKTLAIVSPGSEEGRSYVAANLAVVFSQMGKRTLLVDADLRAPRQDAIFNLPGSQNLSFPLGIYQGPENYTKVSCLGDLSVAAAGVVPPNPLELLCQMQFDSWLKKMAEQFDVILIDTPPAALYTDAVIIAAKTAGALIVTRKDHTHHSETREVTDSLTNAGVEVVGAILNRF